MGTKKGSSRAPRRGERATPPAERMRLMRARRKALGLRPVVTWVGEDPEAAAPWSRHRLLEARSLAMHAVIAQKIANDPELLAVARRNLDRWQAQRPKSPPRWLHEWRSILERPWPAVAARLTDLTEDGARLRQSSPFAGVLTPEERRRIHDAFRA